MLRALRYISLARRYKDFHEPTLQLVKLPSESCSPVVKQVFVSAAYVLESSDSHFLAQVACAGPASETH